MKPKQMAVAITTVDNPFDPFSDFDQWFLYDVEKGYNTCEYLARIASQQNSNDLDEDETDDVEAAIDRIIEIDPFKIYKKIKK